MKRQQIREASFAARRLLFMEWVGLAKAVAAQAYGTTPERLAERSRRLAEARARRVAMYLCHVVCGVSMAEVGRGFGRDPSTACHACRRVEDERDDSEFDLTLDWLETHFRRLIGLAV